MIRAFFSLLILVFSATPLLAEIKIEDVTSPGGIKAWLVEDHGIPFTALQVRFRGGTSLDPEGKRGAVMLMASLLEEGGGDLDAQGFAEARESLAAKFSFDADADSVSISAQFLTENRDAAVALLRKAVINPHFDQSAIDRVRGQVLSIIAANATSPEDIAGQKFDAMLFGDHPYGSNGLGTEDSVKGLTHDDVQAVKDASMARDQLYVAAVGDIDFAGLGKLLDGLFADLPAKGAALPAPVTPAFTGTTTVVDFASPQSKVVFGQPGLKLADPDFYAAYVLNQILGGSGFSARLMDEVREKRGLTYGISTFLATMELSETWQGSFASGNASVGEAIKVVREVWADTAKNGVTEAELDAAKTYMTGSYPLRFDGNSTIAGILVGMQVDGMPIDYVTHRNARIEAVTLADVNRVAHELMKPDALTFVVVGKPDGLAAE